MASSVIDDLRELGTLNVTLTGGEPLTHPEAFEVMAACAARAMTFVCSRTARSSPTRWRERLAELHPVPSS